MLSDLDTIIDSLGWIVETWKAHGAPEPTTTQEGNFTLGHAQHALAAAKRLKAAEDENAAIVKRLRETLAFEERAYDRAQHGARRRNEGWQHSYRAQLLRTVLGGTGGEVARAG